MGDSDNVNQEAESSKWLFSQRGGRAGQGLIPGNSSWAPRVYPTIAQDHARSRRLRRFPRPRQQIGKSASSLA